MSSLKGHFLIAVPDMGDLNFFRSVVLLLQHSDQGAMGLILNRPTTVTVADVWKEVFKVECACRDFVYVGGPVEGPLMILHSRLAMADLDVLPGIFVSTSKQHLEDIVGEATRPFKLFSGYAGWGPGQLEQEIAVGGWLTIPAEGDQVFASPDDLWKQVCDSYGKQVLRSQLGNGNRFPSDPSLN